MNSGWSNGRGENDEQHKRWESQGRESQGNVEKSAVLLSTKRNMSNWLSATSRCIHRCIHSIHRLPHTGTIICVHVYCRTVRKLQMGCVWNFAVTFKGSGETFNSLQIVSSRGRNFGRLYQTYTKHAVINTAYGCSWASLYYLLRVGVSLNSKKWKNTWSQLLEYHMDCKHPLKGPRAWQHFLHAQSHVIT